MRRRGLSFASGPLVQMNVSSKSLRMTGRGWASAGAREKITAAQQCGTRSRLIKICNQLVTYSPHLPVNRFPFPVLC